MEDDLSDPLGIMSSEKEEAVQEPTSNPFTSLFARFSSSLDAAVDATGTTLARRKTPVKELLANGYNADALVREERTIVPILVLEGHYTTPQLLQLGFRWDTLLHGGMTELTFPDLYRELGASLVETFVTDLSSLLTLCSGDVTQVPRLGLTAKDLGLKVRAAGLFAAKMDGRVMAAFGYSIEQWVEDLGLTGDDARKLTADERLTLVQDDDDEKRAFDHFFPGLVAPDAAPEEAAPPLTERGRWRRPGKRGGATYLTRPSQLRR
jgi:hypothetical protein